MDTLPKIMFGLEKLSLDVRDYSHNEHFGTLGAPQLPTQDFTIYDSFQYTIVWGDTLSKIAVRFGFTIYEILKSNPKIVDVNKIRVGQIVTIPAREMKILNQLDLDFCTGYTTVELQKAMYGVECDPLYQFAKIKQIRGEYIQYGANLRDAAQSVRRFGSLPIKYAPYTHGVGTSNDKPRDFLANWLNYPLGLDNIAATEKDLGFFRVDGPYDVFDNIRSTLWMHRQERRAVSFGMFWNNDWNFAPHGVVPPVMPATNYGGGHNIAIIGQKTINGVMHLVFQQSWGDTIGDKGLFYFPRSIVDQLALAGYGEYTFSRFEKSSALSTLLSSLLTSLFSKHD